jgi:hypothetical protein
MHGDHEPELLMFSFTNLPVSWLSEHIFRFKIARVMLVMLRETFESFASAVTRVKIQKGIDFFNHMMGEIQGLSSESLWRSFFQTYKSLADGQESRSLNRNLECLKWLCKMLALIN